MSMNHRGENLAVSAPTFAASWQFEDRLATGQAVVIPDGVSIHLYDVVRNTPGGQEPDPVLSAGQTVRLGSRGSAHGKAKIEVL